MNVVFVDSSNYKQIHVVEAVFDYYKQSNCTDTNIFKWPLSVILRNLWKKDPLKEKCLKLKNNYSVVEIIRIKFVECSFL